MQYIEFGKQNEEVIILLNGHAGSDKHFLSIEELVEMLSQRKDICKYAT